MASCVLVFGNDIGLPQSLRHLPSDVVCGIVAAEIRPHEHKALRDIAEYLHLPFIIQPRVRSPEYPTFVQKVKQINPDLIFVNAYSMLLRPEVLAIPRYGAVNVHEALLPKYRGPNPIQWALLNDETETGVTMHYMDEHFDTGDIIAQQRVPIYFDDTWQDVQERIFLKTDSMFKEEIPKLLAGKIKRLPQDENLAKRCPRRRPEDGQIDWQQSVRHIYNMVRALVKPLPGAFYLDTSGQHIVLDKFLTLPQVTALKYGSIGGQTLKCKRVALIPPGTGKFPDFISLFNNNEQSLFYTPYKPVHESQHKAWFEDIQNRKDMVIFGIRLIKDNKLIGSCQLHSIDQVHRSAELQIRIGDTSERGQGYGIEAVRLLLEFAFNDLNLHRVYLHVFNTNRIALNLYEKAGFKKEGVLREAAHINGEYIDMSVMGILREEYEG
jgi:methionyl-tRNA formyltransferase/RimJ/RimL family protein N-acetyltransferase